jgi:hypothetical protein
LDIVSDVVFDMVSKVVVDVVLRMMDVDYGC